MNANSSFAAASLSPLLKRRIAHLTTRQRVLCFQRRNRRLLYVAALFLVIGVTAALCG
jgi:hypothetical protein